jgi:hypothetical protein
MHEGVTTTTVSVRIIHKNETITPNSQKRINHISLEKFPIFLHGRDGLSGLLQYARHLGDILAHQRVLPENEI